ncbi:MAG: TlpA family protein disulfide reductase, partial [Planctomycetota bacterium]
MGTITADERQVRLRWAVRSLPWLILADRQHVVAAEGFGINELDEKMKMTGSGSSADDVGAKVGQIGGSFLRQRSLFHNGRFKGCYIQPYSRVDGSGPSQPKIVEIEGKKSIVEQEYQLNRDGRFVLTTTWFVSDEKTGERERESGVNRISFDGQVYHSESRPVSDGPGAGSIFTPEHPFDYSKPMVKPTFFMDHVFNDDVLGALEDRENIKITSTAEGKWRLEYRDPASDRFYDLDLDPEQDFMITKMSGYWTAFQRFEKKMEYGKTDEGFYYLKRGTLSVGGGEPTVMVVREFSLNGPEGNYRIEFPPRTRVTDHRNGRREFYAGESEPTRLVGKALPEFEGIDIDFDAVGARGKAILVCFWDLNQRPSRHLVRELAEKAGDLEEKGLTVVCVQASQAEAKALNDWVKKYNISFPVGTIKGEAEKTRFNWGVKSLPWLILTDREHVVTAEGFGAAELEEKIKQAAGHGGRAQSAKTSAGEMLRQYERSLSAFTEVCAIDAESSVVVKENGVESRRFIGLYEYRRDKDRLDVSASEYRLDDEDNRIEDSAWRRRAICDGNGHAIFYYGRGAVPEEVEYTLDGSSQLGFTRAQMGTGLSLDGYLARDQVSVIELLSNSADLRVREATENVDGFECCVLEGCTGHGSYALWLDPGHGYLARKVVVKKQNSDIFDHKPLTEIDWLAGISFTMNSVRIERREGVFVPVESKNTEVWHKSDGQTETHVHHHRRVRIDLEPDFAALGAFVPHIADGTEVVVGVQGIAVKYIWKKGKV